MRDPGSRWFWAGVLFTGLLAFTALPVGAQGGSACTLCNPNAGKATSEQNGVVSQITVPKDRLTLASLVMGNPFKSGSDEVHFLRYGATARLDVGLGYWSDPGKLRPAVNWQLAPPKAGRPGLLVGYGSEPVGRWQDDGVYASLIKAFGSSHHPTQVFAAYFREIDGGTNHLIAGVNQPLGHRWSLYVGHYPFQTWDGSMTYQLSRDVQLGLWVNDFARSPRVGLSLGTGWRIKP